MRTRLYKVRGRWRSGYFLARSSLHSIQLAEQFKVHVRGRAVTSEELSPIGAGPDVERMAEAGETGRVRLPYFGLLLFREVSR